MIAFLSKGLCSIINTKPKLLEEWMPRGPFTTLMPPTACKAKQVIYHISADAIQYGFFPIFIFVISSLFH